MSIEDNDDITKIQNIKQNDCYTARCDECKEWLNMYIYDNSTVYGDPYILCEKCYKKLES